MPRNPIIASLDGMDKEQTISAIKTIGRRVWGFNIDTLIYEEGVRVIEEIQEKTGANNLVINLQIVGTPTLIEQTVKLCCHPTVRFIICNAMAGPSAIRRAINAAVVSKVLVGSILSSYDVTDLKFIFDTVLREPKSYEFALLAKDIKAGGIFCASEELEFLSRKPELHDIAKVVVAIKPDGYKGKGEHTFTLTPNEAMARGAAFLMIGDSITKLDGWVEPKPKTMVEAIEIILAGIDPKFLNR